MSEIEILGRRGVAKFDPKKTKENLSLASAGARHARNIRDWDMLGAAVDFIIEEQRLFLEEWAKEIQRGGSISRGSEIENRHWHGIHEQQASRWRKWLSNCPAYRNRLWGLEYAAAMGLDRGATKRARKEAKRRELPPGDCTLICGDIANVEIEAGSVDLILTDPPYPQKYLPVYETLAKRSAEWLKPGGSLLCMCGQSYLPDILALMTPHIRYHWAISYLTPGGQSAQLWDRQVNTFWKPVIWFVKGDYQRDEWVGDVARSDPNDNDKRFHHWGQSESGIAALLEQFSEPGQLVCDPFVGGGTTAVVALDLGLRFIGCDIDQVAIDKLESAHVV